jgi:hypothetical protein
MDYTQAFATLRREFDLLVASAKKDDAVGEWQWRRIALLGYQLLAGHKTYGQEAKLVQQIEWAESHMDSPTAKMLDNFMQGWMLKDTKEGYRAGMYTLLEYLREKTYFDEPAPEMLIAMVIDCMKRGFTKNNAQTRTDRVLNQYKGFTKARFRTIDKHPEKFPKWEKFKKEN